MKMDPKQVHMAPFGLIFIQDGSHKLWEASGMPPGPQNHIGKSKNHVFIVVCFSMFCGISYHPCTGTCLPITLALQSGLLLVRDDKDFQSCDSATQTLCDPYTAALQSLYSKYTGCADWRMPDFGGKS